MHVKNFENCYFYAQVVSPLTCLSKKKFIWKKGPYQKKLLKLSMNLKVPWYLNYSKKDRPYIFITDAAIGYRKSHSVDSAPFSHRLMRQSNTRF